MSLAVAFRDQLGTILSIMYKFPKHQSIEQL